jgi:hypothetical protein
MKQRAASKTQDTGRKATTVAKPKPAASQTNRTTADTKKSTATRARGR